MKPSQNPRLKKELLKQNAKKLPEVGKMLFEDVNSLSDVAKIQQVEKNDTKNIFANLPQTVEGYVRAAVKNGRPLQLKYYPSLTTRSLKGWRYVLPLEVYSRKGRLYFLAWFLSGSSSHGVTGYRLYLVDNIQEIGYYGDGNFPTQYTFNQASFLYQTFNKLYYRKDF